MNAKELRKLIEKALASNPNANLNNIDVSHITDMRYLFQDLDPHDIHIEDWDVSRVENMHGMFQKSKFNGDISKWNVSNVKDMRDMFYKSTLEENPPKWYKK